MVMNKREENELCHFVTNAVPKIQIGPASAISAATR
jgi:hypothetical protein